MVTIKDIKDIMKEKGIKVKDYPITKLTKDNKKDYINMLETQGVKFAKPRKIQVKISMMLAKHGFKAEEMIDAGDRISYCDESGTSIRYQYPFVDLQTGHRYIFGSECAGKPYLFKYFQNIEKVRLADPKTKLYDIGALFWDIDTKKIWEYLPEAWKTLKIKDPLRKPININKLPSISEEIYYYKTLQAMNRIAKNLKKKAIQEKMQKEWREKAKKRANNDLDFMELEAITLSDYYDKKERKNLLETYIEYLATYPKEPSGWSVNERNRARELIKISKKGTRKPQEPRKETQETYNIQQILQKIKIDINNIPRNRINQFNENIQKLSTKEINVLVFLHEKSRDLINKIYVKWDKEFMINLVEGGWFIIGLSNKQASQVRRVLDKMEFKEDITRNEKLQVLKTIVTINNAVS